MAIFSPKYQDCWKLKILFTFYATLACSRCLNSFVSKPLRVRGGSALVHEKAKRSRSSGMDHSRSGKTCLSLTNKWRNWDMLHKGDLQAPAPGVRPPPPPGIGKEKPCLRSPSSELP